MLFLIYLITFVLVIDCLVLILLVLMQQPKKETGGGLAFGAGATDALFGAGSGNFLTKATKYSAALLFVLAMMVSVLQSVHARRPNSQFQRSYQEQQTQQAPLPLPAPMQPSAAPTTPAGTTPPVEAPVPPSVTAPTSAPAPAPQP